MRDPVDVAAGALIRYRLVGYDRGMEPSMDGAYVTYADAVALARTEATRAGEAMREAAAQACYERAKTISQLGAGQPYIAIVEAREIMARDLGDVIRALPLSDAPASPWPKVKPLVWGGPSFPAMPTYHARSVLGRYAYWRQGDRWKAVCPDGVDVDAPSEESARAVCQGHFQAGILSALDLFTPPAKDEQA